MIHNHIISYKYDVEEIKSMDVVHIFLEACKRDHVNVVEYLLRMFDSLRMHVEDMLGLLINDGWFNVSKYLASNVISEENLVDRCCYEGQIACCSWLLDNKHNILENGYELAISQGHLNIVILLYMKSYVNTLNLSFKINHEKLDVIKILHRYHDISKMCCSMMYPRLDGKNNSINHYLLQVYEQYHDIVHPLD